MTNVTTTNLLLSFVRLRARNAELTEALESIAKIAAPGSRTLDQMCLDRICDVCPR
jgi:hypothetical protein